MRTGFGFVLAVVCLLSSELDARPPYRQSLRRYYGDLLPASMQTCATCHFTKEQSDSPESFDESAPPHNPFGIRLAEVVASLPGAAKFSDIPGGLQRIATEDSDGDGVSNEQEIATGHAPGVSADKPSQQELTAVAAKLSQFNRQRSQYPWEPFRAVRRPSVPAHGLDGVLPNPIDAFVHAELSARELIPRPEASPTVLLRRVTLDLTGLPPTPDELHDFLADASPNAYERVVDRLLNSPHYGERWGRHWMDVWRYSDWAGWTDGKQIRDSQPHIWRWRDWIVESLNRDKPYDQMIHEMLAADEIAPTDSDALRATGFLARNYKMLSREIWMQDAVNHTIQAFLGLTVGCARCHDHMYDAISQTEYYRLRAIFEPHHVRLDRVPGELDTSKDGLPRVFDEKLEVATYLFRKGDDRDPVKDQPISPGVLELLGFAEFQTSPVQLPPEAFYPGRVAHVRRELVEAAENEVAQAEKSLKEINEAVAADQKKAASILDSATADVARVKAGLANRILLASQARVASIKARIAADDAKFANPHLATKEDLSLAAAQSERAATLAQAEVDLVKAEIAKVAAQLGKKTGDEKSEQALAAAEKKVTEAAEKRASAEKASQEKTAEYSPLTAVYPQQSSGRRSALAKWIASRQNPLAARVAVNQMWMRHFGAPLLPTVLDFGQNGQPPSHPALLDWLAVEFMEPTVATGEMVSPWSMKHIHRLIVTSQAYRRASTPDDRNLAIDPDNRWFWRANSRRMEAELVRDGILYVAGQLDTTMGGPDIDYKLGLTVRRRSIYFRHAQEKQMEFLKMFDCAAVTECYQRKESIVPQQALALANSDLTLVQARHIARQLDSSGYSDDRAFVAAAFERVLSRGPTAEELDLTSQFVVQQQTRFDLAKDLVAATGGSRDDPQKPSTEPKLRARENVIHILLNHHDFVTIR